MRLALARALFARWVAAIFHPLVSQSESGADRYEVM